MGTYNGVANPTFTYDANGLMTGGAARAVTATTFDMAASITDGSNTAALAYDTEHARYKMTTTGLNAAVTNYLNDSSTGAREEKVVAAGVTTWHDYILADGKLVAQRFCTGAAPCSSGVTVDYLVLDHLGSVAVIVNSSGSVLSRLAYDAWGKRRNADGSAINCVAGTSPPNSVTRGFTGQEMLDGICLINFNARVYDPSLGRFMSADPTVGDDTIPQELNRFSYVLDNPLSLTDPSGLCFLGCFWKSWIFRDIFALAVVAFIVPEALPEIDAALGVTGPLATVINAGISGGVFGAISTGSLKGAALDALQAGLFAEAGNLLSSNGLAKGFFGIGHAPSVFIAHGFIGGLVSEIGGGRFSAGFLAGGISSLAPTPAGGQPWEATVDGAIESAALGGAGSVLGGGKFENGAVTGAFGYIFNELAHPTATGNAVIPNPGPIFSNVDAAAMSGLGQINPISIEFNTEFAFLLYYDPSANGFGYTDHIATGAEGGADLHFFYNTADTLVGMAHTHGDYSYQLCPSCNLTPTDQSNDQFNSDQFSDPDLRFMLQNTFLAHPWIFYLGTPSTAFLRWDMQNGQQTLH